MRSHVRQTADVGETAGRGLAEELQPQWGYRSGRTRQGVLKRGWGGAGAASSKEPGRGGGAEWNDTWELARPRARHGRWGPARTVALKVTAGLEGWRDAKLDMEAEAQSRGALVVVCGVCASVRPFRRHGTLGSF